MSLISRPASRQPIVDDSHDPRGHGWRVLEQAVCLFTLALLGWRGVFHYQTSYGVLVGLALLPVWLGRVRQFSGGAVFLGAGVLALVGGGVLAGLAGRSGRTVGLDQFLSDSGLVLVLLVGVGVMLWGRTIMSRGMVAASFGIGVGVRLLQSGLESDNVWKFGLAIPLTVLVLTFTDRLRHARWTLIALLVLGAISATHDSRSLFGTFALAAVLIVWQFRPSRMGRGVAWIWTVVLGLAVAGAIYNLAASLLVDGYFGAEAQSRSRQQIQEAGSLILGGRPEIAATRALMAHDFAGFGFGVSPNVTDVAAAKTGMLAINYDPENNYVNTYMFGGHVELHSSVGDLWARTGVLGLVFALVIAILVARDLADSLHRREAAGLVVFFSCYTGWNLFFSPQFSAIPTLTLTLGLGMIAMPSALSRLGPRATQLATRPGAMVITERRRGDSLLSPTSPVASGDQADQPGQRSVHGRAQRRR